MLKTIIDLIKSNQLIQFTLVFLLGITAGTIFYPSKKIEERVSQKYESEIKSLKEVHSKELQESQELFLKTAQDFKIYHDESERKISKLTTEVKTLQSKRKTAYYKLVKPDGTIDIKKFTESEVNESSKVVTEIQEEFKQKITSIENKWKTIHKERVTKLAREFDSKEESYKKEISELKKEKITDINPKKFGIEAGILSNKDYYGHATMDFWGPIFVGVHGQMDASSTSGLLGAGVGLRF
jgi:hypothetical protein